MSPDFRTWRFCCGITFLLFLKHALIQVDVKSHIPCYNCVLELLKPNIGVLANGVYHSEEIDLLLGDTIDDRFVLNLNPNTC